MLWTKYHNISIEGLGLKILSLGEKDPPRFGYGASLAQQPPNHTLWDKLLKAYVDEEGWVNYSLWQKEQDELDNYLNLLSTNPPQSYWSKKEELAFWINAYNAFTVKIILNNFPVTSIKDIGGSIPMHNTVWDEKFFHIGTRKMSLGDIEHRVLRKHYGEPRIHFAINCASVSCPILRQEAFTAGKLEDQLKDQTKRFLSSELKNSLNPDQKLRISPIFKWFSEDFGSVSELIALINEYSTFNYSIDQDLDYVDYDWSLNEQKDR